MKLEIEYQECFLNKQRLNFLQGNAMMVGMRGGTRLKIALTLVNIEKVCLVSEVINLDFEAKVIPNVRKIEQNY